MSDYAFLSISVEEPDFGKAISRMYYEVASAFITGATDGGSPLPPVADLEAQFTMQASGMLPWHTGSVDVSLKIVEIYEGEPPADDDKDTRVLVAHGLDILIDTHQSSLSADIVFQVIKSHWYGQEVSLSETEWNKGLDQGIYDKSKSIPTVNGVKLWLEVKRPRHHFAGHRWKEPDDA